MSNNTNNNISSGRLDLLSFIFRETSRSEEDAGKFSQDKNPSKPSRSGTDMASEGLYMRSSIITSGPLNIGLKLSSFRSETFKPKGLGRDNQKSGGGL